MKKNILALSIQAMFGGYYGGVGVFGETHETHYRPVDYLPPGMKVVLDNHVNPERAVKVRFRGAANSDDVMDFRLFLSPGNFPSGNAAQVNQRGGSPATASVLHLSPQ